MLEAVVLPRARRSTFSSCLGNSKHFLWVGSSLHAVGFHTFGKLGERDKGTESLTPPKSPVDFPWLLLPPLQLSILEPEPESLPAGISQIFLMSSINIICWPLSPLYSLPPSVSPANRPGKLFKVCFTAGSGSSSGSAIPSIHSTRNRYHHLGRRPGRRLNQGPCPLSCFRVENQVPDTAGGSPPGPQARSAEARLAKTPPKTP